LERTRVLSQKQNIKQKAEKEIIKKIIKTALTIRKK